ncbi:MAG: ATP-binding protein [Candidatus Omnitrophica bacterium]|nr:ATP-binding protein [Candidatus Omnitrophota bacterium]
MKRGIKTFLLNFFYRKLWVRISAILLPVVTVPVVVLGILLMNTSSKAVKSSVLSNYQQIAAATANEIGLFVRGPQDILNTTASLLSVNYPAPWKQETILVELALNEPVITRVSSVDLSGRELASSEMGRGLAKWDYPKEALETAAANKEYISTVKLLDNHTPIVIMAVPIKKVGSIVGALVAEVNLRGIWEIVDNIKIGQTGRGFLVSADGTLIAHQDKKRVLKNENLKAQNDVRLALSGRSEAVELLDREAGKLISAYAPIPGLGWSIVIRQQQVEAYLFSKLMMAQSWIIIILSELVAILVSILMGRALASPISALSSRIQEVSAGELDHRIKIRMRDEIGELIRSFNAMTKKLKKAKERERLSAIGEATTWITHELKNSLISIKSFVQLFPLKHKDDKFVDKFSRLVPNEINRLERMFRELSDYSYHSELRITKFNVSEVMGSILEIMKDEFTENRIEVNYSLQNNNLLIEADQERLRQVFMNLIINSINAMPGGGLLAVSLKQVNMEGLSGSAHIEVKIKDTGKGMPKIIQDKLFEPFRTTQDGGMGLGLTISRKIIEQHGGKIAVESQMDKGTAFIVRLPIEHKNSLMQGSI